MNQNQGSSAPDSDSGRGEHGVAGTTVLADTGTAGGGEHAGFTASTDRQVCANCGQALNESKGLEQFLGRLGISDDMFNNLKGQFQNVDIDEYLNTAREYLKGSSTKVTSYTKENPAKVAAGVAALALGAGLVYAAVHRDAQEFEDGLRQLELKRALDGPMYRLDEVLRELDVTA